MFAFIGEAMYASLVAGDCDLELQWKSTAVFFGDQARGVAVFFR